MTGQRRGVEGLGDSGRDAGHVFVSLATKVGDVHAAVVKDKVAQVHEGEVRRAVESHQCEKTDGLGSELRGVEFTVDAPRGYVISELLDGGTPGCCSLAAWCLC